MRHKLKIEDTHYDNIIAGLKTFEVRLNDRAYQKGDEIEFTEVNPHFGRKGIWEITHVHSGLGMRDDFVVLAIKEINP